MTNQEIIAAKRIYTQIEQLENLHLAIQSGTLPSITISAGSLRFGTYTEKSRRMIEMTAALIQKQINTKWAALARMVGSELIINTTEAGLLEHQDYQFQRLVLAGESCSFDGCNFRNVLFRSIDNAEHYEFYNCDFSRSLWGFPKDPIVLCHLSLFDTCTFTKATMKALTADYCQFTNCQFDSANLYHASLTMCNMTGCQFDGANLEKANFTGSTLDSTTWEGVYLKDAKIPIQYQALVLQFHTTGNPDWIV